MVIQDVCWLVCGTISHEMTSSARLKEAEDTREQIILKKYMNYNDVNGINTRSPRFLYEGTMHGTRVSPAMLQSSAFEASDWTSHI
jgi:hypothetical protein